MIDLEQRLPLNGGCTCEQEEGPWHRLVQPLDAQIAKWQSQQFQSRKRQKTPKSRVQEVIRDRWLLYSRVRSSKTLVLLYFGAIRQVRMVCDWSLLTSWSLDFRVFCRSLSKFQRFEIAESTDKIAAKSPLNLWRDGRDRNWNRSDLNAISNR